jgi:DNA-binding transcriptional ArsR family regulator
MTVVAEDALDAVFSALADPTRRAILARLVDGGATVTELAEPFPISLPAVSRHLKVLENAGLITRDRSAQWRPSHLRPEALRDAMSWIETYRALWDERLDRLDVHLRHIQREADGAPSTPSARGRTS